MASAAGRLSESALVSHQISVWRRLEATSKTYDGNDYISLLRRLGEEVKVRVTAKDSLHPEGVELRTLLRAADEGGELERLGLGVGQEAAEDGASDVAC